MEGEAFPEWEESIDWVNSNVIGALANDFQLMEYEAIMEELSACEMVAELPDDLMNVIPFRGD